jgi:tRNA(fMet)-specific endonuclease VapC
VVEDIARANRILLSPIVLGELRTGFKGGTREHDNVHELRLFMRSPRVELVAFDEGTAERYAEILTHLRKAGTPIPTNDVWIAATAMQTASAVLTTDPHFRRVPQVITHLHTR